MKTTHLIGLALFSWASAWGAACTASVAGAWTSAATWGGTCAGSGPNGTPGSGDSATVNVAVTVDQSTTLGTNGATGTYDLVIGNAATVTVPSGVTLTMQGSIQINSGGATGSYAVSLDGGTLTFDPPAGSTYTIRPSVRGLEIIAGGTLQTSTRGGGNAYVEGTGGYQLPVYFRNATLRRIGDASNPALNLYGSSSSVMNYDVQDSTFDSCGAIKYTNTSGTTQTMRHVHNIHTNTLSSLVFNMDFRTAATAGIRLVSNNIFDKPASDGNGRWSSFTISDNYLTGGFGGTTASYSWTAMNSNLLYWQPPLLSGPSGGVSISGPINGLYLFLDQGGVSNPHYMSGGAAGGTLSNIIGGFSGMNYGDSGEWVMGYSPTVQNSVFLCDSTGVGSSEITSTAGFGGTFQHNNWCGGFGPFGSLDLNETYSTPTGSISYQSNIAYETVQGTGTSMKMLTLANAATINGATNARPVVFTTTSSINAYMPSGSAIQVTISGLTGAWAGVNGSWTATQVDSTHFSIPVDSTSFGSWSGTKSATFKGVDVCSAGGCDYNAGYSAKLGGALSATQSNCADCANQGRSYAGVWTATPGGHDLDGQDPMFADPNRKLENFDQKFLGKPLAAAFSSGAIYDYGDIVSNSDGNEYLGEQFNFRCVDAGGCTNDPAPGRAFWAANKAGSGTSVTVPIDASGQLSTVTTDQVKCIDSAGSTKSVSSLTPSGSPYVTSVAVNYSSGSNVTCRVYSTWRTSWEWASLYWIRQALMAGTSYTDGAIGCTGCSVISALNRWVLAGFATQNPRYWGAGHDGKDIGAFNVPMLRRVPARGLVP